MVECVLLDELLADAWPAAVVESVDGWRLRWTNGVTRRANSVLTGPASDLGAVVDAAEAFYRRHAAPPIFSVSTAATNLDLEHELRARGYIPTARTLMMTASSRDVVERAPKGPWDVTSGASLSEAWLDVYWLASEHGDEDEAILTIYREVLLAPPHEQLFTLAASPGGMAGAVGQVVLDRGWGGLQCIATDPRVRRRGAASAVLNELARCALASGVERLYLAVMAENDGAIALYRRSGFVVSHEYCYFVERGQP